MRAWLLIAVALVACQPEVKFDSSGPFRPGSLKIYVAHKNPAPGTQAATTNTGEVIYLNPSPELTEAHLSRIRVSNREDSGWNVALTFNEAGAKQLARVSTDNINKHLAFVIDGRVVTAPVIMSTIPDGEAVLTSGATEDEAVHLAKRLSGS